MTLKNSWKIYVSKEKKPMKWLFPAETAMVIYAFFTLLLVLFTATNLHDGDAMIWERVRVVLTTVALWVVYRIWPCRLVAFVRIGILLAFLSWWYPDTYELNKQFTNLDHVFAGIDQSLFGCQPALLWCKSMSSAIVSEAFDFGYFMYYPLFVIFIFYVFFKRYDDFMKVSFVILAGFYIYYVVFDLLPVTGPQYYYLAVGEDKIAAGIFPELGNYFATHLDRLPSPGMDGGPFHTLVEMAHQSGERPTAAFPSSHVSIATITMILAIKMREWKYVIVAAIPYLLLCFSTVYIQAHYACDAIAGFVTALFVAFALDYLYDRIWGK